MAYCFQPIKKKIVMIFHCEKDFGILNKIFLSDTSQTISQFDQSILIAINFSQYFFFSEKQFDWDKFSIDILMVKFF